MHESQPSTTILNPSESDLLMSNFGLSVKCKLTEYLTYREFLFVEFFVTTVIYSAVDSTGDIFLKNVTPLSFW